MLKFSIITASYNQGHFLQKSIDSVRNQKNVNVEHIIYDNCSTDETGERLQAYLAQPGGVDVKVVVEPDIGQTQAINKGLRIATGDVVCWLNTDEYYHPGALATVAEYFIQHPEVDVVFGDCDFVDEIGITVKVKREYGYDKKMLLYYGCYIPSCATFIRRRVIERGYFLDESFRVCMDLEWFNRLGAAGFRFAHIPVILASFTWHETNISTVQAVRRKQERQIVQLRYGGGWGSDRFRIACFDMLQYYYFAIRASRRKFYALFPRLYI